MLWLLLAAVVAAEPFCDPCVPGYSVRNSCPAPGTASGPGYRSWTDFEIAQAVETALRDLHVQLAVEGSSEPRV